MNRYVPAALALSLFAVVTSGCSSKSTKTVPPPQTTVQTPAPPAEKAEANDKATAKANEAAASASPEDKRVTCTNGNDIRVLEIEAVEGKGCEVIYTKNGNSKSVAKAGKGTEHCEKTVEKMTDKLESGGFKCE